MEENVLMEDPVPSFIYSTQNETNISVNNNNFNDKVISETQENVLMEDPVPSFISSTQNETNTSINNNNFNDKVISKSDPFYNLIEKQAKEFEEFGKRMSLDLQNTYKEYLIQQNNNIKVNSSTVETDDVCKKYDEKIDSQSQLIDSLKARIEELETDSLIKEQDLRKLRNEFNNFKKEIQSVLGISTVTAVTSSAEENVSLDTNENVIKDPEIFKYEPKLVYDEEEKSDCKNVDKENLKPDPEIFIYQPFKLENVDKENLKPDQLYFENHDQGISAKEISASSQTSYQNQYNDHKDESKIHFTYQEYKEESGTSFPGDYSNYDNFDSAFYGSSSSYHNGTAYQGDFNSTYYGSSSSSQQYSDYNSNFNNFPPPHEKISKSQKTNMKVHTRVEEILANFNNRKIPDHAFKPLRQTFNTNQLLQYEKSELFHSLKSDRAKLCIRISIDDELREELSGKKKLTQSISVYINRNIVPPLPPGINSYTEFERTPQYSHLSSEKKKRIQKVISKEKKIIFT
jgi:hypothetical protein